MTELMNNTKSSNPKTVSLRSREELHRTFGGKIEPSDFESYYCGKDYKNGSLIADRITRDIKFDKECIKNAMNRRLMKNGRD